MVACVVLFTLINAILLSSKKKQKVVEYVTDRPYELFDRWLTFSELKPDVPQCPSSSTSLPFLSSRGECSGSDLRESIYIQLDFKNPFNRI